MGFFYDGLGIAAVLFGVAAVIWAIGSAIGYLPDEVGQNFLEERRAKRNKENGG